MSHKKCYGPESFDCGAEIHEKGCYVMEPDPVEVRIDVQGSWPDSIEFESLPFAIDYLHQQLDEVTEKGWKYITHETCIEVFDTKGNSAYTLSVVV